MSHPPTVLRTVKHMLTNPDVFPRAGRITLHPYQSPAIRQIIASIRRRDGMTFVLIFPRQSGKDELLANMVGYILTAAQVSGGEIVVFNPTFKPQTENAMYRLETRLKQNPLTRRTYKKRLGYTFQIGNARAIYLSGEPTANVVSATASLLLLVNEAQDITPDKYDTEMAPMAASTNATRVFSGTVWTDDTLLEREHRAAREAEQRDGIQRVFFFTADDVRQFNEAYGLFVDSEIAKLGRNHPSIKTQYFCERIDATAGMFPPGRIALMRGSHPKQETPTPGTSYALLIDVGGQDEKSIKPGQLDNPARDSVAVTVVAIDPESLPLLGKPTYRTANRREWVGEKHTTVYSRILAMDENWHFQYIIIDATGVGEGLYSMLETRFGEKKVIPVKFTEQTKSQIGYGFIGIIETGRYREYSPFDDRLLQQLQNCAAEARTGPNKPLSWGVPNGKRAADGTYLHDDLVISAALVAELDEMEWYARTDTAILPAPDLLSDVKGF